MGLKRFLARRGVVGGTARWAGRLYFAIKEKDPGADINDIMKEMLEWRYTDQPSQACKDGMMKLIDSGRVLGLANLVSNILSIEAGYRENTEENRLLFMDVIEDELRKLGVPEKDIFDYSRSPFAR